MIKKIIFIYILVSSWVLSDIDIYSVANYKPYSYIENGVLKGIQIDILKSIFDKIKHHKVNIKEVSSDDIISKLQERDILILNNSSPNSKESEYIDYYSEPFFFEDISIFCNRDLNIFKKKDLKWPNDFGKLRIINDGVHIVDKSYNITIKESLNFEDGILSIVKEESDCVIGDELRFDSSILNIINQDINNSELFQNLDKIIKIQTIYKKPIHIGFSKKYFPQKKDLLKNINLAIRVMNDYNDTEEIIDKYKKKSLAVKEKTILAVIYPWGFLVSKKIDGYGILPEIVSSAFKERGIKVKYKFRNSNYAYLLNKWGSDCLSFPWTKKRDTDIYSYISNPLIISEISFFYIKNRFINGIKYNDFYDIKDYRLGGLKGAFYENIFGTMSFNYTVFDTVEDMLTALVLDKIDIIPINEYLFRDAVLKYMPHKIDDFSMIKKPMVKKANYILFSKKCENASFFRNEFNEGFKTIQGNSVLDKILEKHSMTKEDRVEFESFFADMKKIESEESSNMFDINSSRDNNSSIDINDSNLTI